MGIYWRCSWLGGQELHRLVTGPAHLTLTLEAVGVPEISNHFEYIYIKGVPQKGLYLLFVFCKVGQFFLTDVFSDPVYLPVAAAPWVVSVQAEGGLQVWERAHGRAEAEVRRGEHGLGARPRDVGHRGRHVWK